MKTQLIQGDSKEELYKISDIDTIITDPPYGLSFMGKKWDYDVPSVEFWKVALASCKPGATALVFAGSRTSHRMACNMEDAGWVLKDTIMWLYGSGFPKATDISKQLYKGKERKVIGLGSTDCEYLKRGEKCVGHKDKNGRYGETIHTPQTEPSSDEAKLWNGWKSHGLKPSYEPLIWAHKPLTIETDSNIIGSYSYEINILLCLLLEKYAKTDTSSSQEVVSTLSNIATLWSNVLEESSIPESMCTISMETGLITELKTLRSLIYATTADITIKEKFLADGLKLSVDIANNYFKEGNQSMTDTQTHTVQEIAIWAQSGSSMFARFAPMSLQPIIQNVSSALQSAMDKVGRKITPNHEPIIVAMKPNDGTYANNALKHGVSGLNIDGGRIPTTQGDEYDLEQRGVSKGSGKETNINFTGRDKDLKHGVQEQGRFPANIILDEEAGEMLDEQSGESKSSKRKASHSQARTKGDIYKQDKDIYRDDNTYGDKGGASRFFYCAKASKKERNEGLEHLEAKFAPKGNNEGRDMDNPKNHLGGMQSSKMQNHHPTVKPLALMEYLVKLTATPTGGVVLDPFMGSGTTGLACKNQGRDFIGIELDKEYFNIAKARIEK